MQATAVRTIQPYLDFGTWVFDDPATGLIKEPFVDGVPEIIESIVGDADRFSVDFSETWFPNAEHVLVAAEPHVGGIIYKHEKSGLSGWLCPALFLYFNRAPERIYARFYNVHVSGGPKP